MGILEVAGKAITFFGEGNRRTPEYKEEYRRKWLVKQLYADVMSPELEEAIEELLSEHPDYPVVASIKMVRSPKAHRPAMRVSATARATTLKTVDFNYWDDQICL